MLKTILTHIDFLTEQIKMLDQEVAQRVISDQEDIERLDSIPGIAIRRLETLMLQCYNFRSLLIYAVSPAES
jgi:transposase